MSTANFNRAHQQISNLFARFDVEETDEEEEDLVHKLQRPGAAAAAATGAHTTSAHVSVPVMRPRSAPQVPASLPMWQPPPQQWIPQPPEASVWQSMERGYMAAAAAATTATATDAPTLHSPLPSTAAFPVQPEPAVPSASPLQPEPAVAGGVDHHNNFINKHEVLCRLRLAGGRGPTQCW